MKDPYQILGVSPSATDEEIKDAYRALVKKYHPDKFADSDLAELANEKMKEVNAAYDEIQKMRSNKSGSGSRGRGDSGFNPSGFSNDEFFSRIRQLINSGNVFEAEQMLINASNERRGAEWHYLYACVMIKKGYYADAQRYFDMACSMDPNNLEYRHARDQFRARSEQYGSYRTYQNSNGCCDLDCCTSLICADCCCECMGGDLIACC